MVEDMYYGIQRLASGTVNWLGVLKDPLEKI
jgi:hypothetical protein